MDSFERPVYCRRCKERMDIGERVSGSQTLDGDPSGAPQRHSETSCRLWIGPRIPSILDAVHQTDAKTDPCLGYFGRQIQYDLVPANREGCTSLRPFERTVGFGSSTPGVEIDEPSGNQQVYRVGRDGFARGGTVFPAFGNASANRENWRLGRKPLPMVAPLDFRPSKTSSLVYRPRRTHCIARGYPLALLGAQVGEYARTRSFLFIDVHVQLGHFPSHPS